MLPLKDEILDQLRSKSVSPFLIAYSRARQKKSTDFRFNGSLYSTEFIGQRVSSRVSALLRLINDSAHKAKKDPERYHQPLVDGASEMMNLMRVQVSSGEMTREDFHRQAALLMQVIWEAIGKLFKSSDEPGEPPAMVAAESRQIRGRPMTEALSPNFEPAMYGYWIKPNGQIDGINTFQGHNQHMGLSIDDAPFWVTVALEKGWIRVIAPSDDDDEMTISLTANASGPAIRSVSELIRGLMPYRRYHINDEFFAYPRDVLAYLRRIRTPSAKTHRGRTGTTD